MQAFLLRMRPKRCEMLARVLVQGEVYEDVQNAWTACYVAEKALRDLGFSLRDGVVAVQVMRDAEVEVLTEEDTWKTVCEIEDLHYVDD